MNNLSQVIADIFAPLSHAQKMRVNLTNEQVFDGPEQPEYRRCIGCGGHTRHSRELPNGDVVALCGQCVLDGQVLALTGQIEREIAPYRQQVCDCKSYEHGRDCLYHLDCLATEQDIYERAAIHAGRKIFTEPDGHPARAEVEFCDDPKTKLRGELADLLAIAEAYQEQADQHAGQAQRLAKLAKEASEQADNLRRMAGL